MSFSPPSLKATAVDAEAVWRVFGCKDAALEEQIVGPNAAVFDVIPWPSHPKAPTRREGLALFIAGEPLPGAWIESTWTLLDYLFWLYGTPLPCIAFRQVASLRKVTDKLAKLGSTLDLTALVSEQPPAHIPTYVRYPRCPEPTGSYAFLDAARTKEIHADVGRLTPKFSTNPRDAGAAIEELQRWLATAVELETGLAMFYR